MSSSFTFSPGDTGLQGTLYAVPVILVPSCTLFRILILLIHLPETEAGQPPATNRSGYPCTKGISSPFILNAKSVSSCKALDIGHPLEIGSLSGSILKCLSIA